MSAQLPVACLCRNAAGTAVTDYLKVLYDFIVSDGGLVWSAINLVGGATPSSFTAQHADGFQVNFRTGTNAILGYVSPNGGVVDSASATPPSGALAETEFFRTNVSQSVRTNISLTENSIVYMAQNGTFNAFLTGFAAGRGRSLRGNNRHYQLANVPNQDTSSSSGLWFSVVTTSTIQARASRVEFGVLNGLCSTIQGVQTSRLTNQFTSGDRIAPLILTAADSTKVTGANAQGFPVVVVDEIGFDMRARANPLVIAPSSATNQSWLYVSNANAVTDMVILWNKTVDPTTPT